jgi:hypothetical protein
VVFESYYHKGPRSDDKFGSLIFTLPTAYEGGMLHLRHRAREFSCDVATLLHSSPPISVAYVAFCGEVDHEAWEVTLGYRVTISTFNLYSDKFQLALILAEKKINILRNPSTYSRPFVKSLTIRVSSNRTDTWVLGLNIVIP